jgi:hypothetical protein
MAFENVGFSRAGPGGVKYLVCAECELGPLGWADQARGEFWVAVERVGYR